jgi:transposase
MMAALIAGERDPQALAQLARSRIRTELADLREALEGTVHRASCLPAVPDAGPDRHYRRRHIAMVEDRIEDVVALFAAAATRLGEIPGVGVSAARAIVAEVGWTRPGSPPPGTWPAGRSSPPASTNQPG